MFVLICFSDLGAHIDGFIAVAAHTTVATESTDKITGRKADVVLAAYWAGQAAIRLLKPGSGVSICQLLFCIFLAKIK